MKLWNRILCAVLGHKLREKKGEQYQPGFGQIYYECVRCGKKEWWVP